jgi:hypothetical protein
MLAKSPPTTAKTTRAVNFRNMMILQSDKQVVLFLERINNRKERRGTRRIQLNHLLFSALLCVLRGCQINRPTKESITAKSAEERGEYTQITFSSLRLSAFSAVPN